jgi:hypothetical protein
MTPEQIAVQIHRDCGSQFTTDVESRIAMAMREYGARVLEEEAQALEKTTYLKETIHQLRTRAAIVRKSGATAATLGDAS